MKKFGKIITVGLSPSWDMRCQVNGLDWGLHKVINKVELRPAGKALNISKALAWMSQNSTAAGLWGKLDYKQMLNELAHLDKHIAVKFTAAPGRTRQNITLVDTAKNREMHLRAISELATKPSLKKLYTDLQNIISKDSICTFAGAMPDKKFLDNVIKIMKICRRRKAKLALDTSGPALKSIVDTGNLWLIKPNIDELSELIGKNLSDNISQLIKAAQPLLAKAQIILISRGQNGVLALTKESVWQARYTGQKRKVLSTVGCGDYLLAGFLKGFNDSADIPCALKTAIIAATAKAFDICEHKPWPLAQKQIKVEVKKCKGV